MPALRPLAALLSRTTPWLALLTLTADRPNAQTLEWGSAGGTTSGAFGSALSPGEYASSAIRTFVVGAPASSGAGQVKIHRADNGHLVGTLTGPGGGDLFGLALDAAGDLDGDGVADIVVGAPHSGVNGFWAGSVHVYSGATLAQLPYSPLHGQSVLDQYGTSVAILGDLNGDGFGEFAVGAPYDDVGLFTTVPDGGSVRIHSGKDGSSLALLIGTQEDTHFGWAVAAAGDVNGDGVGDIVVGEPGYDATALDVGRVRVFAGATWAEVPGLAVVGAQAGAHYGESVAGGGDVNRDGTPDYIVGAPDFDFANFGIVLADAGRAEVHSGANGALLHVKSGLTAGGRTGWAVDCSGDLDHDGYDDFGIGSPGYATNDGRAQLWSGRTGECLYDVVGQSDEELGAAVAIVPRNPLTVQVYDEFAIGRPKADVLIFGGNGTDAGRADLYAGKTRWDLVGDTNYGSSVAVIGDVDLDGFDDFLIGSFQPSTEFPTFAWDVRSGKDSQVLFSKSGPECVGSAVGALGDVTGDGRPEFLIGNPCTNAVYVRSGFDGSNVSTIFGPPGAGLSAFGSSVGTAGDVNGDGINDILIGDPEWDLFTEDDYGKVYLYSGVPTQTPFLPHLLIDDHVGGLPGARLGHAVAPLGDVDGDGVDDYAISAPKETSSLFEQGRVLVYSGATGQLQFQVRGEFAGDRAGWSIAGPGDVNGDGFNDLIIGEPGYGSANLGRFRVVTGPFGALVFSAFGDQLSSQLGWSVAALGDVDRDGVPDVASGEPEYLVSGMAGAGRLRVWSGATSGVLYTFTGGAAGDRFGGVLHGVRDVGPDDRNELLVGVPNGSIAGSVGYTRVLELPRAQLSALGVACGVPGSEPQASASLAYPGELLTIEATEAHLDAFLLMISTGVTSIPVGGGCILYVDPLSLVVKAPVSAPGGTGGFQALVPEAPGIVGLQLTAQALVPQSGAPQGYGLTRALRMTVGY